MEKIELLGFIIAFIVSILLGIPTIKYLKKLKFGQEIRKEGLKSHYRKAGTPTMGGIFFIATFVLVSLFFVFQQKMNIRVSLFLIISSLFFAFTGITDDYAKISKKDNLGLNAKQKISLQLLFSVIMILYVKFVLHYDESIVLPFSKKIVDIGWLYYPFIILVITGTTNGVNLSDGLDGLCAGISGIALIGIALFSDKEVASLSMILSGALFGFLVFNFNPAKVFMGDTGSLFIGGYLAAVFIILKQPFHLVIIGMIYVVETLSVMLQVVHFKRTGKRLFLMAPIHHHFEMKGYSEKKIVLTSYLIQILLAIILVLLR